VALPLPETLTPSKISKFVWCPLAFRYSYIDHLPEPPTLAQATGTLVHRALQLLHSNNAETRTLDGANAALETAWTELVDTPEFVRLRLANEAGAAFRREAESLMARYFGLERPEAVTPVGIELDLRARFGEIELRGIIDRLDRLPDGEFAIVDYKTGRAPPADRARSRLAGVLFYAYLCEEVFGRRPREVRLMYLKDQVVIVQTPSDQAMRGMQQRALAVWRAIERACENDDFRPNPSTLCRVCPHQSRCPAFASDEEALASCG
jgi:putative RecB family exonuclease